MYQGLHASLVIGLWVLKVLQAHFVKPPLDQCVSLR